MEKNKFRDMPRFSDIKGIIYNSVKLYPNNTAFTVKHKVDKNVSYRDITYSELLQDINALGTAFHKLGLRGKRIAIVGKNSYEWAAAHLCCMLGDMISVPLDKDLQIEEMEQSLARSKAEAIVFDEKHKEIVQTVKERGNTMLKDLIYMGNDDELTCVTALMEEGRRAIANGESDFAETESDPDAMSILLFTSGTTSNSKAVMLSQNAIATNVYDMQLVETFLPTDVNIAFLPYHHIFGSTAIVVMLASGVKTVFPDGLRYIKQNLIEYKVSIFVGVPLLIDKMYSTIEKEIERQGKTKLINRAIALSNILLKLGIDVRRKIFKQLIDQLGGGMRMIIAGGAPLDKKIARGFNEIGIHLVQGYGLTETSPVISAENDKCVKYGSVGIPMRSVEVKIDSPDKDGIGEIKVKGPSVMLGYYENEEATENAIRDGWFYTGDLGYFDDEGYLFITGRKKDMVVMKSGKKIFPEEIEALINRNDEIEDSFVFGMPSKKDDVRLAVKVVCDEAIVRERYGDVGEDELHHIIMDRIEAVNDKLPSYKHIRRLIISSEPLIKTTTCKTKRHEELKKTLAQL